MSEKSIKNVNIQYKPIFDQSAPGVWDDFARIQIAATSFNFSTEMFLRDVKRDWSNFRHNFAFGAYHNNQIIGFIRGKCFTDKKLAEVSELFVLPEYRGYQIGRNLLAGVESGVVFDADKISVRIDVNSGKYFIDNGYTADEQSPFTRFEKQIQKPTNASIMPIFYVGTEMNARCNEIAAAQPRQTNFDASHVNDRHLPMWVAFSNPNINGFVQTAYYRTPKPCVADTRLVQTKLHLLDTANAFKAFAAAQRKKSIVQ